MQKNLKQDLEKWYQRPGELAEKLFRKANGKMTLQECFEYAESLADADTARGLNAAMERCIADFKKRKLK